MSYRDVDGVRVKVRELFGRDDAQNHVRMIGGERGYARSIRRSTLPHILTYREMIECDPYHRPVRVALSLLPRLIYRWLTDGAGQGNALISGLLRGCLDQGCELALRTCATRLILEDGVVRGVQVVERDTVRQLRARLGVLLATGGYEWDDAMLAEHFPGPVGYLGSPSTNTGDGQRMAAEAGARLERMDQANVYPSMPIQYEGTVHALPIALQSEPNAIVVNGEGKRFASEYAFNMGEALDLRGADGYPVNLPAWLIGDRRFIRSVPVLRHYAGKAEGWLHSAATIAELARLLQIPPHALAETVARYNGFCEAGTDDDFGRGSTTWERYKSGATDRLKNPALGTIERAPFYAVPIYRSILGTKGGARTDETGRVLHRSGGVIGGLYCAGLAMANPIGTRAVGAGTTLGPNMTWGYIVAETLLESAAP